MRPLALCAALALMATTSSADAQSVYRCQVDGRVKFQDRPCADAPGERVNVAVPPPSAGAEERAAEIRALAERQRLEREAERERNLEVQRAQGQALKERADAAREREKLSELAVRGSIAEGMTADQVTRAWGSPSRINRNSGGTEQWVYYRRDYRDDYVYFEDGVVTGISVSR